MTQESAFRFLARSWQLLLCRARLAAQMAPGGSDIQNIEYLATGTAWAPVGSEQSPSASISPAHTAQQAKGRCGHRGLWKRKARACRVGEAAVSSRSRQMWEYKPSVFRSTDFSQRGYNRFMKFKYWQLVWNFTKIKPLYRPNQKKKWMCMTSLCQFFTAAPRQSQTVPWSTLSLFSM